METTSASFLGSGYPSSRRSSGGTRTKIAATAAKESWKPGSRRLYGFHASSTAAPSRRKYQRSRGREASHASEASAPATPALTTDGCQPTASTYAPTVPSAAVSPTQRGNPSIQASRIVPITTYATFWPDTASKW